jgi:transposase
MREKILPHIVQFQQWYEATWIGQEQMIFIEDRAGAHRAAASRAEYTAQGVKRMYHPPSSPDLNSIEHI